MDVAAAMQRLGGVSTRAQLIAATSRADTDRALRSGLIIADRRGRYCLPGIDEAVRVAHRLGGLLCRESAALHHGWAVKSIPDLPHVSVPRKRKVDPALRALVHLHRDDLLPEDVDGVATSRIRTLEQCLKALPFDAALAVADSALREGLRPADLRRIAATTRGPGCRQARQVARAARPEAANPFESVLRAIALGVPGLHVEPQVVLRGRTTVRPDLVDRDLGIVLEADSFAWHGDRLALRRDARRYNLLVADGWLVLRFSWEDVMFDPGYVTQVLQAVVALVSGRTHCPCCADRSA